MGKLRVLSAREVCRILEENGFVQVRQRGSHIIMQMQNRRLNNYCSCP
ncbi:type II toxin-antitoxin system HicA family toxin [Nostoc sp.]